MKKKWYYIGGAILVVLIAIGYYSFEDEINGTSTFKVKTQDLAEIVSEVGKVVPVQEIDFTFPLQGTVAQVAVTEGQNVIEGDLLMKLDDAKTQADLANVQAAVQEAQARLDKAYAGASSEEVTVSATTVLTSAEYLSSLETAASSEIAVANSGITSAETRLSSAQNDLTDQIEENEEDLKQAYEDALDILRSSNTKADTAIKTMEYIQDTYFTGNSNTDKQVSADINAADNSYDNFQDTLNGASASDYSSIDAALSEQLTLLNEIADALAFMRESLETDKSLNPSVTDEGYVNAERSNIDTAITNTNSAIQTISTTTLENENTESSLQSDVDEAQAALTEAQANLTAVQADWDARISEAEGAYNIAQDEHSLLTAAPREEDIALYQAQLNQAIAYAAVIQQDFNDNYIYAPTDGIVTNIYLEVGELATLTSPAISMIAEQQYQVEAFISELDIATIEVSDPAELTFDAFGRDKPFEGTVLSIDPFETIEDGDIFYKVTIQIDEYNESIRSGMTVNIRITSDEKEDVLVVPSRYVGEEAGIKYVKLQAKELGEDGFVLQEVTTGIKGIEYTEIMSGLEEGDILIPYY